MLCNNYQNKNAFKMYTIYAKTYLKLLFIFYFQGKQVKASNQAN